ncbi:MAG: hypothetical protein M9890_06285 [Thermomicrobiales bacterium]|nr:hypothetical protein [Thermomicrobiales bacterium]
MLFEYRLVSAGGADAEDLKPVTGDLEVGARAERLEHGSDGALVKLDDGSAVGANQMMPMAAVAFDADIAVTSVRPVQSIEKTTSHQHVQCSEDSRPPDRLTI